MNRSLNRVVLIGHAGARPELRTTRSGSRVATFSLATDRPVRPGEAEKTDWHRVVAWDGLAEWTAKWVDRGDRVFVEGRVEHRSWEDASGRSRQVTEVVAEDVMVFEGRAGGADQSSPWKEGVLS
jgi:single-strand DNA-binding protein